MRIAVASGKGGTGKTMVSASLAAVWDGPVNAVDLDVEEPNLHLFLHPVVEETRTARLEVPVVDEARCTFCRECAELCQYKAISVLGEVVLTFPEMCHGCGGCIAVCPENAISPGKRPLGEVVRGKAGSGGFWMGRLRVGEAMSPPLMREVLRDLDGTAPEGDVIIDAPPGVSCPAVSAVIESDIILLVTEPTPFGTFDLRLAHKAFQPLNKPMGVVINRSGLGDEGVYRFCKEAGLPILCEIPFDRSIAAVYAEGRVVSMQLPAMERRFRRLCQAVRALAQMEKETAHA
jgi:MinD superfamily P-loop ATPase